MEDSILIKTLMALYVKPMAIEELKEKLAVNEARTLKSTLENGELITLDKEVNKYCLTEHGESVAKFLKKKRG